MVFEAKDKCRFDQPAITDDRLANSVVKLLMHVCSYCLVKVEPIAGVYSALLAAELTLGAGVLSPHSASALLIYGVAETFFGIYDRAYRYGQIELAINERMPNKDAECLTVGCAIASLVYLRETYAQMIEPLFQVADGGFQCGDIYAPYCLLQILPAGLRRRCAHNTK